MEESGEERRREEERGGERRREEERGERRREKRGARTAATEHPKWRGRPLVRWPSGSRFRQATVALRPPHPFGSLDREVQAATVQPVEQTCGASGFRTFAD